jgi:hypothetical protein
MPPNHQHSMTLNRSPWKRSVRAHGVTGLGANSGASAYWLPLPSYRVDNRLHSISGWFKIDLGSLSMLILAILLIGAEAVEKGLDDSSPKKSRGLVGVSLRVLKGWNHGGGHVGF